MIADLIDIAKFHQFAAFDPHSCLAEIPYLIQGMRDEEDRLVFFIAQFFHVLHAFLRKPLISYGQGFIDDDDIRIQRQGNGEPKT